MKLIDLIRNVSWIQVESDLERLYPEETSSIEEYERVYSSLLAISPAETTMRIAIRLVQEKDDSYYDVYGLDNLFDAQGDVESWALDFVDWNEWISMEIDSETLDKYELSEIAAHCLWEMTFYGFYPEQITQQRNHLDDLMKGIHEGRERDFEGNQLWN